MVGHGVEFNARACVASCIVVKLIGRIGERHKISMVLG